MQDEQLRKEVNNALDRAERIWKRVEPKLVMMSESLIIKAGIEDSLPSNIPGYPQVNPTEPEVDDFIAFVLDIRNSSKHLTEAIGGTAKVSQLKRVLYEITAINTIGSIITDEKQGKITEFLGDGFLALYRVSKNDKQNVYKAHDAAKECIRVTNTIVNSILSDRYKLPPLKIGIGMAYSQAIITTMGYGNNLHPKALGECVFRATKLSDGTNEILIDDRLKHFWPSSKNGNLQFNLKNNSHGFNGYTITYATQRH